MGIIVARGMGIMDHRLLMATPLRPMAMGILITDRGTMPDTDTAVIMAGEGMVTVVMDTGGRSVQVYSHPRAIRRGTITITTLHAGAVCHAHTPRKRMTIRG